MKEPKLCFIATKWRDCQFIDIFDGKIQMVHVAIFAQTRFYKDSENWKDIKVTRLSFILIPSFEVDRIMGFLFRTQRPRPGIFDQRHPQLETLVIPLHN